MRLLCWVAFLMVAPYLRAETRPNFVFVVAHDISPDDLSVDGNTHVQTANLERIARVAWSSTTLT